jgi:methylglutaconyl-CoA hydratase
VALGLVARAVPAADLDAAVEAEVAPYLACAPGAVAEAKALARSLAPPIDEALIERTVAALVRRWEDPEATAGIAAFFERRPPPWAR